MNARPMLRRVAVAVCLTITVARAQSPATLPANYFPFYIPWDDATPGTANDMSSLNHRPAGKFGRVVARDGHFALSDSGERIRFFATNLGAESALPATHADADAIAASLAKRGVNLVRLHHLDNTWAIGTGSLWDKRFPDRQHVDPAMLDRLDYLVSRLIDRGIYVNLNLKVGKVLTAADGFPAGAFDASDGTFPMQKRIDHFDRRMIELQKAYARTLLAHVNAYTGRRLADEPGVAMIEISNENGLLSLWPGQPFGSGLDKLADAFRAELTTRWNDWLTRRYGTDAKLLAAWNAGIEPLGASALPASQQWAIEQNEGATCDVKRTPTTTADGPPDLSVRVTNPRAPDWLVQANLAGLTLEQGRPYTFAFEARSDAPRSTRVSATLDREPWSNAGLGETLATTPQWRHVEYPFVARGTVPGHVRIGFALGDSGTRFEVRNVTLRAGTPAATIASGTSLAAGTVPLPTSPSDAAHDDLVDFLADADDAYAKEMTHFVRDELGARAMTYVSQVQWGGLLGYRREAASDLIDAHGYVGHPQFAPGADWSPTQWTIENKSEVRRLGEGRGSVLGDIAMCRQAGKPFTVSEYDEPAPSDFAAECIPMLAGFAAAQDWDAVYPFVMPGYGTLAPAGRPRAITGFFDQLNHTAKAAFYPFAAAAIRNGGIATIDATATLHLPADAYRRTETADAAWRAAWPQVDALSTRLALDFSAADATASVARAGDAASSLGLERPGSSPVLRMTGPSAAGLVGFVGGATTSAGALSVAAPHQGDDFAAITVHTLDGKAIGESSRGLVTIVGRAENVGMRWNAARTSVGDGWGNGPVQVEGLTMTVTLARARPAQVWTLDERGKRKTEVPARFADGRLTFDVTPQQASVWYEFAE